MTGERNEEKRKARGNLTRERKKKNTNIRKHIASRLLPRIKVNIAAN